MVEAEGRSAVVEVPSDVYPGRNIPALAPDVYSIALANIRHVRRAGVRKHVPVHMDI